MKFGFCNKYLNRIFVFLISPLNFIDLIIILGFSTNTLLNLFYNSNPAQLLSMLIFLRLIKLASFTKGFWVFYYVLGQSMLYILYILIFMSILIILSGAMIYYVESYYNDENNPSLYKTIFDGMWWSVVTVSTVGFHIKK
ncbi:hypothetical protein MHBO_001183 [Bonamia ostreae]|uniref:Ion transport domain-containing protein n=1 Tax=Bonamia ostreae TaxID=126728 RepID=A0ABV2AI52_9EUKA